MSFTYGFYNSVNGDRRYNAEQMAAVFDCLINDGVQENIGSAMVVVPAAGNRQVAVGTGRAWFNSTWSYNDAAYPLTLDAVTAQGYSRIDAICLVVDKRNESRVNRYEVVRGVAGNAPTKPVLPTTDQVFYHPLAYVTVDYGVTSIPAAKIENRVGTTDCPFITGILQTIDITTLLNQWHGQFEDWFEEVQAELTDDVAAALLNAINHLKIKETTMNKYGFSNNPEDSRYQEYPVDAVVNQIYILLSPVISDVSTLKANSGKIKYGTYYKDAATYFEYYAIKDLTAAPPTYGYGCQALQTWCTGDGKWAVCYGYKPGQTNSTRQFFIVNLTKYTTTSVDKELLLYLDNKMAIFGTGNTNGTIALSVYNLSGSSPTSLYTGTIVGYCTTYRNDFYIYRNTNTNYLAVMPNVAYDVGYFVVCTSYTEYASGGFTVYSFNKNTKVCISVGTIPAAHSYGNYMTYMVIGNGKIFYIIYGANKRGDSSATEFKNVIGDFYNSTATTRASVTISSQKTDKLGMFYKASNNTCYFAGGYNNSRVLLSYNYNTSSLSIGPTIDKVLQMLVGSDDKIYIGSSRYNMNDLHLELSDVQPISVSSQAYCNTSDLTNINGKSSTTSKLRDYYSADYIISHHLPNAGYYTTTSSSTTTYHSLLAINVSPAPLPVPVIAGGNFILFGNLFERRRVVSIPA